MNKSPIKTPAEETVSVSVNTAILAMAGTKALIKELEASLKRLGKKRVSKSQAEVLDDLKHIEFLKDEIIKFSAAKEELSATIDAFLNSNKEEAQS